jgi:hypothetical protein
MDFSKEGFLFVLSRYRLFSKEILSRAFALEEDANGRWIERQET